MRDDCINRTLGILNAVRGRMLAMHINPDDILDMIEVVSRMAEHYKNQDADALESDFSRLMALQNYTQKAQGK